MRRERRTTVVNKGHYVLLKVSTMACAGGDISITTLVMKT
ncbi:predicted protein [Plenodomus lingam JN3]|uniref:Predicted protein n=1 Tax=Leptosphaeria maculans (strain JN3 / isolate v23.1.3 / race Av1-4-5-6-7-8) TaxID=985895 RepID=E4ZM06_LEPMJ|nr:predicted protein [Plenodomus lingam JN3]CBX92355.1 predicted protein [Plenodomus lingam JN3]